MRIEIIEHDSDHLGLGVSDIAQPVHLTGEVMHGPLFGDMDMPAAAFRFTKQKQIARPIARVLAVINLELSRLHRKGRAHLSNQLFGALIEAYDRAPGVIGRLIQIQHILHSRHKLRTYLGDTFAAKA